MGSNAPAAGTPAGDELFSHEAAHAVQQQDAARDPVQRQQPIGGEDVAAEADADKLAARVVVRCAPASSFSAARTQPSAATPTIAGTRSRSQSALRTT